MTWYIKGQAYSPTNPLMLEYSIDPTNALTFTMTATTRNEDMWESSAAGTYYCEARLEPNGAAVRSDAVNLKLACMSNTHRRTYNDR